MNKLSEKTNTSDSISSELIITLPVSFIVAHLFVGFRQEENYLEIFLKPGYLPDLIISMVIVFALIVFSKVMTRYLDAKYPWHNDKPKRYFLQFCYVFLVGLGLNFLMAVAYFSSSGINISETIYFDSYLFPISMFIVMVNMYYVLTSKSFTHTEVSEVNSDSNEAADICNYTESNKVVYITIVNKIHFAKNEDGEFVFWNHNLTKSKAALPTEHFFPISRRQIVHRNIIKSVKSDPLKREIVVYLKEPFNDVVEVAGKLIADFKQWWY